MIIQSPLTPEIKKHIYEAFDQHAISCTGIDGLSQEPTVFEVKEYGLDSKSLAWIAVQMFWGQLHIKYLLVEENHRHLGYGTLLMDHAFEFAKKQGCKFVFVETMNFQAPDFYQKLGFKIEFVRHGYDKKTSLYYLKKDLL
jgi:ribosomal protein S18 acetylase RimI-like enzyme